MIIVIIVITINDFLLMSYYIRENQELDRTVASQYTEDTTTM